MAIPKSNVTMPYDYKVKGFAIDNGGEGGVSSLEELSDVAITEPTDGQALVYDGESGKWVNGAGGGGETAVLMVAVSVYEDGEDIIYDITPSFSDVVAALNNEEPMLIAVSLYGDPYMPALNVQLSGSSILIQVNNFTLSSAGLYVTQDTLTLTSVGLALDDFKEGNIALSGGDT